MLKKVLIANRGEIACRVIRACREMGIRSVAIYSEADRESLHVKIADEAICVGAGSNGDSYLNLANVLMACQISGSDAVHPGYGYFSERANFASALESLGIKFIGPPVKAIESMGDKAMAKKAAIASGCPVVRLPHPAKGSRRWRRAWNSSRGLTGRTSRSLEDSSG